MFIFRDKDHGNQWSLMVNRDSRTLQTTDLKLWKNIVKDSEEYKDKSPEELDKASYEAYNDALANMQHMFVNNGYDLEGTYHSVKDMYAAFEQMRSRDVNDVALSYQLAKVFANLAL